MHNEYLYIMNIDGVSVRVQNERIDNVDHTERFVRFGHIVWA